MKIYLEEAYCKSDLSPLSLTRHVADIRIGILTIREKWSLLTGEKAIIITDSVGQKDFITIAANIIPTKYNYETIISNAQKGVTSASSETIKIITYPWDIFTNNNWALHNDFELLTEYSVSHKINGSNHYVNADAIFIEEGARVNMCMLNASNGPIYIGKDAEIMEGSMIRGPFAILDNSVIKMGAKIYGATTIGKNCVAGGEIKNSILFDNSNKAHDGYLGDSVIGSWCNLGAGTTNSNVKNTAGEVSYKTPSHEIIAAGNKAGLIMGDYSRSAINTSFNTGTIVGVCCNIFGNEMPEKYVPDFSWGKEKYDFDKATRDISNWKKMKNQSINENEISILKTIYHLNK